MYNIALKKLKISEGSLGNNQLYRERVNLTSYTTCYKYSSIFNYMHTLHVYPNPRINDDRMENSINGSRYRHNLC